MPAKRDPLWLPPRVWVPLIAFMCAALWAISAVDVLGTTKEWDSCYGRDGRPAGVTYFPLPKAFCELASGEIEQIAGVGAP